MLKNNEVPLKKSTLSLGSLEQLSVAICGTRGVPARYGGFETFAEELGKRLVGKGVKVRVYSRFFFGESQPKETKYLGIDLKAIFTIKHKYFETPLHSFFCFLHLITNRVDVVILCNAANSPFAWILRLFNIPFLVNVDGIERSRRKWNSLGKAWYYIGEACSSLFANKVVSDATYIREYYLSAYATDSALIRYGSKTLLRNLADKKIESDSSWLSKEQEEILSSFKVMPNSYFLYVSRLEPENNADKVIIAYSKLPAEVRSNFPLLIVGDAPYAKAFKEHIRSIAAPEVQFLGYQFAEIYETLQSAAYLYIQATEVGGTHPALVEAMGFANCIIANRVMEHEEVLLDTGFYYDYNNVQQLSEQILELAQNSNLVRESRRKAFERAMVEYDWGSITESYLSLIQSLKS